MAGSAGLKQAEAMSVMEGGTANMAQASVTQFSAVAPAPDHSEAYYVSTRSHHCTHHSRYISRFVW